MITKEDIETRMSQLRQEFDQAKANLQAINGAIEDCKYWLEQTESDDEITST